jgi:hypothetical protein
VFFKVDGSAVAVTPSLTLAGSAVVKFTPGSHGNLLDTDVDAGDVVPVPANVGEWTTSLVPIAVPPPFDATTPDLAGTIGVVCVLMEEDNVSDSGAEAGHQALNSAVKDSIDQIIATRSFTNQEITDSELAAFESQIRSAVEEAIKSHQGFFSNLWSWLNKDDTIGFKVFMFGHDKLATETSIDFSERWKNEGDWELTGNITVTETCGAQVISDVFDAAFGSESERSTVQVDLDAMREFRSDAYQEMPGLALWWQTLERNLPAIRRAAQSNPEIGREMGELLAYLAERINEPTQPISDEFLTRAKGLAAKLAAVTRSRQLRKDSWRVVDALETMQRGLTVADGLEVINRTAPIRYEESRREGRVRDRGEY